jgi:hypothetical protein
MLQIQQADRDGEGDADGDREGDGGGLAQPPSVSLSVSSLNTALRLMWSQVRQCGCGCHTITHTPSHTPSRTPSHTHAWCCAAGPLGALLDGRAGGGEDGFKCGPRQQQRQQHRGQRGPRGTASHSPLPCSLTIYHGSCLMASGGGGGAGPGGQH